MSSQNLRQEKTEGPLPAYFECSESHWTALQPKPFPLLNTLVSPRVYLPIVLELSFRTLLLEADLLLLFLLIISFKLPKLT